MTHWVKTDGGRAAAGYKGDNAGDCGARALAIVTGMPYKQAYKHLAQANKDFGFAKSARDGIYKHVYDYALKQLGFQWCSAPKFDGRKARASDLDGAVIAQQAGHFVAVIDGVIHDSWDSTNKMVYGYWMQLD